MPVVDGSITDLTVVLGAKVGRARSTKLSASPRRPSVLRGILVYNTDEIVSTDIVGSPASCTFDFTLTMALAIDEATTLAKVLGWYDNEWGYSNRLIDSPR